MDQIEILRAALADPRVTRYLKRRTFSRKSFVAENHPPKRQITITADTGRGKTELINRLKMIYPGWVFATGGGWFRDKARSEGFGDDVNSFAQYCKEHPETDFDFQCDSYLHYLALTQIDGLCMESRVSHALAPNAYHVLLLCDVDVCAERRAKDTNESVAVVKEKILSRDSNDGRLLIRYPDYKWSEYDYHQVIRTDKLGKNEAVSELVSGFEKWWSEMIRRQSSRSAMSASLR
jgi:cytidylate kinase